MPPVNESSLSSLIEGWVQGRFHRVTLLGGPDTLTKEEAVARLRKEFLGADPSGGYVAWIVDSEGGRVGLFSSE